MQHHTLIAVQLFVFSKQGKIGGEEDAQDTLYTAYTLDWYRASPHRCGISLGFQSFIKLTECSFPMGLKDLTYIFVIFIAQMEAAEVN